MNKGVVIIGPKGSGKTLEAKKIAGIFDNVVFIDGKSKQLYTPFGFSSCNEETELIVVDEISEINDLSFFYRLIEAGVYVDRQSKPVIHIHPKIIVVCKDGITEDQLPKEHSFTSRFYVIDKTK